MTGAARRRALGWALAAAALLAAPAAAAEPPLSLHVDGPVFAGEELVLGVRQAGVAAGQPLALQVVIDGASVGRYLTEGDRTILRVRGELLRPGRREIQVKSGTLRARLELRVWPAWARWAAPGSAALLLAGLFAAALLRRRRLG